MKTSNTKINQIQNFHNSMNFYTVRLGSRNGSCEASRSGSHLSLFLLLVGLFFLSQGFPASMEPVLELSL